MQVMREAFVMCRPDKELESFSAVMQGLMPTLLEDVPDMAVKFTVYESLRSLHHHIFRGRQVCTAQKSWQPYVPRSCRIACADADGHT